MEGSRVGAGVMTGSVRQLSCSSPRLVQPELYSSINIAFAKTSERIEGHN
ncbi:hypothetical protein scyTo_0011195, partial [Scyliorhinus torazame]|nr:hypothetical protein [Scyliorhinus torazame]